MGFLRQIAFLFERNLRSHDHIHLGIVFVHDGAVVFVGILAQLHDVGAFVIEIHLPCGFRLGRRHAELDIR